SLKFCLERLKHANVLDHYFITNVSFVLTFQIKLIFIICSMLEGKSFEVVILEGYRQQFQILSQHVSVRTRSNFTRGGGGVVWQGHGSSHTNLKWGQS